MKFEINGLSVNTFGDRKNTPIIFIHGFPFNHTMWKNQIDALMNYYYCITYDVRGLGQSIVGDGQYTMEFYVSDLLAIINEIELVRPVICGLSMGGYIALRAVEKNQDIFRGLILSDTRADADDNAGKLKRSENINIINTQGLNVFVDQFVKNCFSDETPIEQEKMYKSVLHKSYSHNPIGIKGAIIAIMSRTDTSLFLSKIRIPTLVLCGSFDKITPPILMRSIAEKIKNSEFGIIPRAGHMAPLENPTAFNDLIKGFLKRRIVENNNQ